MSNLITSELSKIINNIIEKFDYTKINEDEEGGSAVPYYNIFEAFCALIEDELHSNGVQIKSLFFDWNKEHEKGKYSDEYKTFGNLELQYKEQVFLANISIQYCSSEYEFCYIENSLFLEELVKKEDTKSLIEEFKENLMKNKFDEKELYATLKRWGW